jgi:hypothetical protein
LGEDAGAEARDENGEGSGSVTGDDLAEDEYERKGLSSVATVLLIACIILFVFPWVILGVYVVRNKIRRRRIQLQKAFHIEQ